MRRLSTALRGTPRVLEGYHIKAAAVIERLPVMAPALAPWEVEWEILLRKKHLWRLSKIPEFLKKDFNSFVLTEFLDAFYDGETFTEDDKTGNLKSHRRLLDQTLFLLVKNKGEKEWSFPSTYWKPKESIRRTAGRSVNEYFDTNMKVFFTGLRPLSVMQVEYKEDKQVQDASQGEKTFFLRAYYVSGSPDGTADYVWVPKADLPKYVSPTLYESVEPMLDH